MERKLPNYFRKYRRKHGLGQKQMAELIGKGRHHVLRLEQGKYRPSLSTAIKYSILFGIEISDLMPELYKKTNTLLEERLENQPYLFSDKESLKLAKSRLGKTENISDFKDS